MRGKTQSWRRYVNLIAIALLLSGALYFAVKNNIFADTTPSSIPTTCHIDPSCNDGFSYTTDVKCSNNTYFPTSTTSTKPGICKHIANRPIIFASNFPTIDSSGFIDRVDVAGLGYDPYKIDLTKTPPTGILKVQQKAGNNSADLKVFTNKELFDAGKMMAAYVDIRNTLITRCNNRNDFPSNTNQQFSFNTNRIDILPERIGDCSQAMTDYLNKFLATKDTDGNYYWRSVMMDELIPGDVKATPNNFKAIAQAIQKFKQTNPGASVFVWGSAGQFALNPDGTPMAGSDIVNTLADVIKSADYYMPEYYVASYTSELISSKFTDNITSWESFFSQYNIQKSGSKILYGINPDTADGKEGNAFDVSSHRDFFAMLDNEFKIIKDNCLSGKLSGVALWRTDGNYTGSESAHVLGQLIDRFKQAGSALRFGRASAELTSIGNSGFEFKKTPADSSTASEAIPSIWSLATGVGGSIKREISSGSLFYGGLKAGSALTSDIKYFKRFPGGVSISRVPESESIPTLDNYFNWTHYINNSELSHDLSFSRGSTSNFISQPIAGLVTGQIYKFELYSKKMSGDYLWSGVKSQILNGSLPIDQVYSKSTYYNVGNENYNSTLTADALSLALAQCKASGNYPTIDNIKVRSIGKSAFKIQNTTKLTDAEMTIKSTDIFNTLTQSGWLSLVTDPSKKKISGEDEGSILKDASASESNLRGLFNSKSYLINDKSYVYTTEDINRIVALLQEARGCNNDQNLWTKETIIFKYTGGNLNLSIDDSQAIQGDVNIIDFAQLEPYYIQPFELRADKSVVNYNDNITYTVEYHNYSSQTKANVALFIPVNSNFSFVSASNGGTFTSGKVTWTVPAIQGGGFLYYTFIAKAKSAGNNTTKASVSFNTSTTEQSNVVAVQTLGNTAPSPIPSPLPSPSILPSVVPSPSPSPSVSSTPRIASVVPSPSPSPSPSPGHSPSTSPSPSPSPSATIVVHGSVTVVPSPSPSPSPSVAPRVLTPSLSIIPDPKYADHTLTITAAVTDTSSDLASTSYTFWWNCNNPSTSVTSVITDSKCGQPRNLDDPANSAVALEANGHKVDGKYAGTSTGKRLLNSQAVTTSYPKGIYSVKVIIERGNALPVTAIQTINVLANPFPSPTPSPSPSVIQSQTSTPTPAQTTNYTFPKGFSTFGTTKNLDTAQITSVGLYVYKFDGANNKWLLAPGDQFSIKPWQGYYVYNPSTTKTITLSYDTAWPNLYQVTKGWNMLFTSHEQPRSELQLETQDNSLSGNLSDLINQGQVNPKVFIIDNTLATDACSYFSLLDTTNQSASCPNTLKKQTSVPAGKAFWVYVK